MSKRILYQVQPEFRYIECRKLYDVIISIETNNNKITKIDTVSYEAEVHFLPHENKEWKIILQKYNLRLNGNEEGDGLIDELVLQAARVLKKIIFAADEKGKIKAILNFEEITALWIEEREAIELTYNGHIIEDVLNAMERKLSSKETLMNALLHDPFIVFYFNNIFASFNNLGRQEQVLEIRGITSRLSLFFDEKKLLKERHSGFLINSSLSLNKVKTDLLLLCDGMLVQNESHTHIEACGNIQYEVGTDFEINNLQAVVSLANNGILYKKIKLLAKEMEIIKPFNLK